MEQVLHLGLDVGSTTVKLVVLDNNAKMLYSKYQRHFSDIKSTIFKLICALKDIISLKIAKLQ